MSLVVMDTDVASATLRNRLPDQLRGRLAGHTMAITFVSLGELTKWTALRSWDRTALPDWLSGGGTWPYSRTTKR